MNLKRILLFLALFLFMPLASFSKNGFGVQGGFDIVPEPSAFFSLTWRTDKSPWGVAVNVHPFIKSVTINVDNWFVYKRLASHLDGFVLWGISGGGAKDCDYWELTTGSRFGGGLSCCVLERHLEFYVQVIWNPHGGIKRDDGSYKPVLRLASFPSVAGLRFWF